MSLCCSSRPLLQRSVTKDSFHRRLKGSFEIFMMPAEDDGGNTFGVWFACGFCLVLVYMDGEGNCVTNALDDLVHRVGTTQVLSFVSFNHLRFWKLKLST